MQLEIPSKAPINKNRFPSLNLPASLMHPWYQEGSLLNLPAAVAAKLGCDSLPHPALQSPFLQSLPELKQVILVLLDGLSYERFSSWIERTELFHRLSSDGFVMPLTSVVPSTTCTVLTTLWTGRSPAEHAVMGDELFLKEYGIVSNMISHSPIKMPGEKGVLYRAGFEPETAALHRNLGSILKESGISSYAFLNKHIRRSGLSRMHYADVLSTGFASLPEMWITLRTLAEKKDSKKRFIWCYYEGIDNMSHHRHPDKEFPRAEFEALMHSMQEYFLKPSDIRPGRTLMLFTADHGQIATPDNSDFDLSNHPDLLQMLHLYPTGENRLTYLHVQPGKVESVREYFQKHWGDTFVVRASQEVLEQGLFGPGQPAPQTRSRIGDLTVISTSDNYLWWGDRSNPLEGRHGGLSASEMVVPLAGFVL